MSVTLELTLMVVALLVAVGGIGVALALRRTPGPRRRAGQPRPVGARAARARTGAAPAAARSAPTVKATTLASATKAAEPSPEQAHRAKLEALQAMLALGDRQAAGKGGPFPDTEPTDAGYAATEFIDHRADPPKSQASLLNLDKEQRRRPRS